MANVSKRTIQNKIKNGILSASRDDSGFYQVDSSEFFRVYPDAKKRENKQESQETQSKINTNSEVLKAKYDALERENILLKEQLSKSEAREKDLIDTLKSNTRLLEYQREKKRKKMFGLF
jgi:Fe-S cluster assembly ATPase SufC